MSNQKKGSSALLIGAVVFIIWGILGMLDAKNYTYAGFSANNNEIYEVEAGSPAEEAGMQVGDVIKTNGGIDVNDSKSFSERDRPSAGDTREYVVDRNGESTTLQLTFAEQTSMRKSLNLVATIMGFIFIVLGIYTHRKLNSELTYAFAVFAVLFGFIFMGGPYFKAGTINNIMNAVESTVVFLSFVYLAIFMLRYPPESAIVSEAKSRKKMFYPAIILILILWYLNLFQPDFNDTFDLILRLLFGVTIIFYFGIAVVTLIKKYAKASSESRTSSGLNYMLLAAVLGLGPILISFTISTISPTTIIPGNDYIFLTFLLIPIFSMLALMREATTNG